MFGNVTLNRVGLCHIDVVVLADPSGGGKGFCVSLGRVTHHIGAAYISIASSSAGKREMQGCQLPVHGQPRQITGSFAPVGVGHASLY